MKKLLLLLALPAFALDNGVVVSNNFTGALTNHPVWGSRFFKKGELPNYCRPFATPSTTGTRAAISVWQCNVLSRWRDATAVRTITSARSGSPSYAVTAPVAPTTGMINIVVNAGIATANWGAFGAPAIALGDRLVVTGTPTTANSPSFLDNNVVHSVSGTSVNYISRSNKDGTFQQETTGPVAYTGGVTVDQKIDPLEPPGVCRYFSANHGFRKGETVTISGGGLTPTSPTQIITGITRDEFVTNATCTGTGAAGTATGPTDGSVKMAFWAVFVTVPAAPDTVKIDWVNSTNPCSSGDQAACDTAGFSRTNMLAATWNFDVTFTADVQAGSTAAITRSARAFVTAWNNIETYCGPRTWAKGPVRTWAIFEYRCVAADAAVISTDPNYTGTLGQDFGWKILGTASTLTANITAASTEIPLVSIADITVGQRLWSWYPDPDSTGPLTPNAEIMTVTALTCSVAAAPCVTVTRGSTPQPNNSGRTIAIMQWVDAPSNGFRSLHPRFDLSFVTGWGVKATISVSNYWMQKMQNLWYAIDIKTGGTPATRLTRGEGKHTNNTSWKMDVWDGADPEFFCKSGAGTDPANCATTGGGQRARRYLINYNTPYISYTGVFPEYTHYASMSGAVDPYLAAWMTGDRGGFKPNGGLGEGTFGQAVGAVGEGTAKKGFDGAQEAYILQDVQALCLHAYSASCYEILYGDSVPYGGGNAEAQWHIPWHYFEDDDVVPRYVMPGFGAPGTGFGRSVSPYGRPTFVGSADSAEDPGSYQHDKDYRRTACGNTAAAIPPTQGTGAGDSSGTRGWPCHWLNAVGNDGWIIDAYHQGDWSELAFFLSADPRYLELIQSYATWNYGRLPSKGSGRSWVQPEGIELEPARAQGGIVRATVAAHIFTPTVPQYGATTPSVVSYLWDEKIYEIAYSKEAMFEIQDGIFNRHYPWIASSCGAPSATNPVNSIWRFVRCKTDTGDGVAIGANRPNPLPIFSVSISGSCPSTDMQEWMDCSVAQYVQDPHWWSHKVVMQWERFHYMGYDLYDRIRAQWARVAFASWNSTAWNPYMNDLYEAPVKINPSKNAVNSMAQMFAGLKATWNDSGTAGQKDDGDWCHQSGRCFVTATSYQTQWRPDIASLRDMGSVVSSDLDGCTGQCTWQNSWNFIELNIPKTGATQITQFGIQPHSEVFDLACTKSGTTGGCTYTPPTTHACTYRLATTQPTDTLDGTDISDGGSGTGPRTLNFSSLTAGSPYFMRLTCGQRVTAVATGTGRSFATLDIPSVVRTDISGKIVTRGKVSKR